TFSDTGLTFDSTNGTTYFYRITAFGNRGDFAESNVVSAHLGPINSHVKHSTGFASNSDLTATGSTTFPTVGRNVVAELTDGGFHERGNFFTNAQVGVETFTTTFTFRQYDGTNPEADGFTFILQSNSPSATGPGPDGGGLGYGPDSTSGAPGFPNSI